MIFPPDIQAFLSLYPRFKPDRTKTANVDFYSGNGRAKPDDATIDELLTRLEHDWDEVESNHGFIQWLFPIPEHGMNWQSQPLEPHEATAMSADPVIIGRLLRAYELMLSFYGIRMVDRNLASLERAEDWKSRFRHLLSHPHNLLRITRILKSVKLLSPSPQAPSSWPAPTSHHPTSLVLFLLAQHNDGRLNLSPGTTAGGSLDRFWLGCVFDPDERECVSALIRARAGAVSRGDEIAWGEREYVDWVQSRFDKAEDVEEEDDTRGEVREEEEVDQALGGGRETKPSPAG